MHVIITFPPRYPRRTPPEWCPQTCPRWPTASRPQTNQLTFADFSDPFSRILTLKKTSQHIYVSTIKVCSFDILGSKRPYEQRKIVGSLYQIRT